MRIENSKSLSDPLDKVVQIAKRVDSFLQESMCLALGPLYSPLSYEDAELNLRFYRAKKNWEEPSLTTSKLRRDVSIAAMLKSDGEGMQAFCPHLIQDDFLKYQLQLARLKLEKNIARHYRFKPERVRMPSGETFVSAEGDVSLVAKLRDKTQWCVTPDCFELAAQVIYSVPGLKRAARRLIGRVPKESNKFLWSTYSHHTNAGFLIFKELLLDIVTIVPGLRLTTVPKNNSVDRVIGCEPFLNMLVQSVVEEGIRSVIKTQYHIDLSTSADIHKALISDYNNVTIDFQNASNSNYLAFTRWFFQGSTLLCDIEASRSPIAVSNDIEHELTMVAPMGGGFTFGLMSLILLAISREFDSFSHVFGDDLIVDKDVAQPLIQLYEHIGYITNPTKTFLQGNFRESCGAFISNGKYITSFEFYWPTDLIAAATLTNKVGVLAYESPAVWGALWRDLLKIWGPEYYSWVPSPSYVIKRNRFNQLLVETRWICVYDKKEMKLKRTCALTRKLWEHNVQKSAVMLKQIQLLPTHVVFVWEMAYKEKKYKFMPLRNVHAHWYGLFLWSGRCLAPTIRYSAARDGLRVVKLKPRLQSFWSHDFPSTVRVGG